MLTIKQITENTEAVIRGLEKKHFKNAKETIDQVIALNDKRRTTQNQLDKNLAEVNSLSRTIGQLMKEGKKEEAESARARVAELKEGNKELDAVMTQAATEMQNVLYTIPNVPYDSVPEGVGAEDNVVEKMGGMETELPKDALPHWELAKKYDLIDFDLGVKITGAGFPVYKGTSTCPYQLLPGRSTQVRIYRNHAADSCQRCFRLRHRTTSRQRRTDVSLRSRRFISDPDSRSPCDKHLS